MSGENVYDIDYDKYKDLDVLSRRKNQLHKIGHKLYFDYQVNAFFFCRDIYQYSTIHEAPEFLFTLSSLNEETTGIDTKWKEICKPYVVKYKGTISDYAYFSFYGNKTEFEEDRSNNWIKLRRWLISYAIDCAFGDLHSDVYAYMNPETVIAPENIIEYMPAEKWRKDVLKYFGKE